MRSVLLGAALAALLSGCRSAAAVDGVHNAECPVCRHEGDLACVCVHIEPDTPRCERNGKTYYFCSDECRADFLAQPGRYAGGR